ncbi:MAG TPA: cation diffusion facilitator family transporter [Terracidiphilus sp.]
MSKIAGFSAEKRKVALHSMLAAAAMTLLKLGAGLVSGSLGVLSDAAHSALDMVGSMLTFFSVQVSDRPADEDHTYGHGKFENFSSFGEVLLMAVSSGWIIWEAIQRILHPTRELQNLAWPVAVVLASIGVDFWRSRQLRAVADRTGSTALATDAFHFASDIWSSAAVLAGLGASWVGAHFGLTALRFADPLAAVVVSLLILRLTVRLGHEAVSVLLDEIPAETRRRLIDDVAQVPGVLSVEQARVRRAGANYFADLTLALPRRYTFEHTGELVREATEAVQRALPEADVVIHTVPRQARAESIFDRVRAVAARNNVSVHELSVQSHQGRLRVEQHLELDESLTLLKAHDFVCGLEAEILREVPEIDGVLTHIESEPATIEQPEEIGEENRRLEEAMQLAAAGLPEIVDVHEIKVGHSAEHIHVTCHCTLPDELTMQRVHEVITALEYRFKKESPEVYRVTIHPEPVTDNLR